MFPRFIHLIDFFFYGKARVVSEIQIKLLTFSILNTGFSAQYEGFCLLGSRLLDEISPNFDLRITLNIKHPGELQFEGFGAMFE